MTFYSYNLRYRLLKAAQNEATHAFILIFIIVNLSIYFLSCFNE